MPLILEVVTAPVAKNSLLLADVKKHLNVDHDDDDDHIASLIKTAYAQAEAKTRRALMPQTWDYYLDSFPTGDREILIPKPPLQSITSIKYQDGDDAQQTWSSADYVVDTAVKPGRVYLETNASFPSAYVKRKSVVIRFVAGYSSADDIPKPIIDWMKIFITDAYDVMRQSYFVGGVMQTRPMRDTSFADALLATYEIKRFGY